MIKVSELISFIKDCWFLGNELDNGEMENVHKYLSENCDPFNPFCWFEKYLYHDNNKWIHFMMTFDYDSGDDNSLHLFLTLVNDGLNFEIHIDPTGLITCPFNFIGFDFEDFDDVEIDFDSVYKELVVAFNDLKEKSLLKQNHMLVIIYV